VQAFAEHVLVVAPLGGKDQTAYDYASSFDFTQPARQGAAMQDTPVPADSQQQMAANPQGDSADST
jgi:hypothetical protein